MTAHEWDLTESDDAVELLAELGASGRPPGTFSRKRGSPPPAGQGSA